MAKPAPRFWLATPTNEVCGPYHWSFLRALYGLGHLNQCQVCLECSEQWFVPEAVEKISKLTESQKTQFDRFYEDSARTGPPTELQLQALGFLGWPPLQIPLCRLTAANFIYMMTGRKTHEMEWHDPKFGVLLKLDSHIGWLNDPASDAQKDQLRDMGLRFSPAVTKGEAHQISNDDHPATEPQLRRLAFMGLPTYSGLTKRQASELIDGYFGALPEEEARYQSWKADTGQQQRKGILSWFK
jgi:hypothetical protein